MDRKNGRGVDLKALALSRRTLLQGTAGVAVVAGAGSLGMPRLARAQDVGLVALVHTQAAGDNGPIDSMIGALQRLSEEQGFEIRTIYAQDPATYDQIFRSLGDAGASVIVSTFLEVAEPFKALAPEYPDTKWIQLFADPFDPPLPNVVTVSYDYYLGCYLSALFGGRISKTGKLGYIGGASMPGLNADLNAMKAAADDLGNVTVTSAWAGSFQDPAKGHEIASQMYQDGVDYIQTDSAATDTGIIQAANEGEGRLVSAISPEQYKLGPSTVIALVALDFGQSLYNEVAKAIGPDWAGGTHVPTGLGTGVIDFHLSPVFLEQGPPEIVARAQEIWPEIEAKKAEIIAGTFTVPFITEL